MEIDLVAVLELAKRLLAFGLDAFVREMHHQIVLLVQIVVV